MAKALSLDQIQELVKKDSQKKAASPRTKKDPTEPREYSTWWKLQHVHGKCENENCVDTREGGGPNGSAMVAKVKEKDMCRYCFLDGWLSDAETA